MYNDEPITRFTFELRVSAREVIIRLPTRNYISSTVRRVYVRERVRQTFTLVPNIDRSPGGGGRDFRRPFVFQSIRFARSEQFN